MSRKTTDNACASVALLNIINNVPGIDLGDELEQFKGFTADLSPALRGYAIINFSFVKQIHNSFARYAPLSLFTIVFKLATSLAWPNCFVRLNFAATSVPSEGC